MCNKLRLDISGLREDIKEIIYSRFIDNNLDSLDLKTIKQIDNDLGYLDIVIENLDNNKEIEEYKQLYKKCLRDLKKYN